MSKPGLLESLNSSAAMDAYLEVNTAQEIIDDIRAAMAPQKTLRDYFGAQAMQAMLSRPDASAANWAGLELLFQNVARMSFDAADAMLKAREVQP